MLPLIQLLSTPLGCPRDSFHIGPSPTHPLIVPPDFFWCPSTHSLALWRLFSRYIHYLCCLSYSILCIDFIYRRNHVKIVCSEPCRGWRWKYEPWEKPENSGQTPRVGEALVVGPSPTLGAFGRRFPDFLTPPFCL